MTTDSTAGARLNRLLDEAGQLPLAPDLTVRFEAYLDLLVRWNARMNLTAIRDEDGILSRHFLESIVCAQVIPSGISALLDVGSGAGFPGIPIALCRPEVAVTLAESQNKKAAFLREAARTLGVSFEVHAARAETLARTFDCVTLRAVDRMDEAIRAAVRLVAPDGWLVPFTTTSEVAETRRTAENIGRIIEWQAPIALPRGSERILLLGRVS